MHNSILQKKQTRSLSLPRFCTLHQLLTDSQYLEAAVRTLVFHVSPFGRCVASGAGAQEYWEENCSLKHYTNIQGLSCFISNHNEIFYVQLHIFS